LSSKRFQLISSQDRPGRLAQWFRELKGPLRRFIAGRRDAVPTDIDDIAQEVFLRLLRYDRAGKISDPRAYLFKIAGNVASEWSMRARQRLPHESIWLDDLTDETDIAEEMERTERNSQLYSALGSLPTRAREILRLHFGEALTHEAIAARLGVTRRVVKRDIVRAYASLRFALTLPEDRLPESEVNVDSALGSEL
jgi:RNA polymerase sigma factor (sigma-70 family)